jgi:uncharacterized membrane-anchored protein YjiN (DUF445 family)
MANPLSKETAIWERIKRKNLKIDDDIWELIQHHIGNDVYRIQMNAATHVTGDSPEPISVEDGKKMLKSCEDLAIFLKKLRAATKKSKEQK